MSASRPTAKGRTNILRARAAGRPLADPPSSDFHLERLRKIYAANHEPIEVSFRSLLKLSPARTRFTHGLHPYPGRLLPNIPAFFLSSHRLAPPESLILDPFCGSGTVLLESILTGRDCVGADSNPLARLITKTKTTPIERTTLQRAARRLLERVPTKPQTDAPLVLNEGYWFYPHIVRDLRRLREAIDSTRDSPIRDLFTVVLSSCIRDLSLADPRLSVPVRLRADQYEQSHWLYEKTISRLSRLRTVNVVKTYQSRLDRAIELVAALANEPSLGARVGLLDDARSLHKSSSSEVDLVITSPPYVGAQKYIRACSLNLTWLGMCEPSALRALEDSNIGREHFSKQNYDTELKSALPTASKLLTRIRKANPLRAHIAATYLQEMRVAFESLAVIVRRGGHLVLVVGSSTICGLTFPTPTFLSQLAEESGFEEWLHLIDPIRSRALMTKRHRTANTIATESIIVFRRR